MVCTWNRGRKLIPVTRSQRGSIVQPGVSVYRTPLVRNMLTNARRAVNCDIRPLIAILEICNLRVTLDRTFMIMKLSTFSMKSDVTSAMVGSAKKCLSFRCLWTVELDTIAFSSPPLLLRWNTYQWYSSLCKVFEMC